MPPLTYKLGILTNSDRDEGISLRLLVSQELRMKEKRILAVILAHSLIHFGETAWLKSPWSKEQITFLRNRHNWINLRQPFLSTELTAQKQTVSNSESNRHSVHRFPNILALAIILLEIELAGRLDEIYRQPRFQEQLLHRNPNTDFTIAQMLLEEFTERDCQRNMGPIEKCLDTTAFSRFFSAAEPHNDPDFMVAIYESIVVPLEQELEAMLKSSLQDILSESSTDPIITSVLQTSHNLVPTHTLDPVSVARTIIRPTNVYVLPGQKCLPTTF
jgi:hypothetical protein